MQMVSFSLRHLQQKQKRGAALPILIHRKKRIRTDNTFAKFLIKRRVLLASLCFFLVILWLQTFLHIVHSTTATATTATRGELDAIVTVAMCGFRADDMVRALRTN
eukprot:10449519-Ditylum_brightwellii.AAC.1